MTMDWWTVLGFVGFLVVSAGGLLYISMAIFKEKSYDEAIAEQRQQTSTLLGTQTKSKLKDKKQKKAGKKVKEKTQSNDTKSAEKSGKVAVTTEDNAPALSEHTEHHVEFKEAEIIEEPIKESSTKRKEETIKAEPVLKEKQTKSKQQNVKTENENKSNKKSLAKQSSEADSEKSNKKPVKQQSIEIETKSNTKPVKQQPNETVVVQNSEKEEPPVVQEVVPAPQTNGVVLGANVIPPKEKKKKRNELNTIQQLANDKQAVNLPILQTLVGKAELSRSEVQILIDMLLNKQHEAPMVINEWSEGKADPVQKLKRQLAEKEKLLIEEQEALTGAQNKLKEVRAEQIAERSQLQQKSRALEETLNAKQLELQATNGRTHGLNQKLQTLQTQINEEMMKSHKLIEDNNALQMHMQQMEMRVNQYEEMKETMENDIRALSEQFENQKSIVIHQQHDLSQKDEVIKLFDEQRMEMDRHINIQMMQENEQKNEIQQLKTACQQHLEEIRRLELNKSQSINELKAQREDYERTVSQLNQELQRIKDEKQKAETHKEKDAVEEKKNQIRIKNLENDLSSQSALIENLKSELEQQKDKNNALREKNWKVMEALNIAENRNKKQSAINTDSIVAELKQQRLAERQMLQRQFPNLTVDDNLPYDQWCSQVETFIDSYIKDLELAKVSQQAPKADEEIQKLQLQILQNKKSLDEYDELLNTLQRRAAEAEIDWQKKLSQKNTEVVAKDKTIKDGEDRIEAIEQEREVLREETQQLRLQLAHLETQLIEEQKINERLRSDRAATDQSKNTQSDVTLQVERLHEEMNRMSEQLLEEQITNKELRVQIDAISNLSAKTLNLNNSSNGPSVTVENN